MEQIIILILGIVLGFLLILISMGMLAYVKVTRLAKSVNADLQSTNTDINNNTMTIDRNAAELYQSVDDAVSEFERRADDLTSEFYGVIDSRLDKLESKLNNK